MWVSKIPYISLELKHEQKKDGRYVALNNNNYESEKLVDCSDEAPGRDEVQTIISSSS